MRNPGNMLSSVIMSQAVSHRSQSLKRNSRDLFWSQQNDGWERCKQKTLNFLRTLSR